MDRPSPQDGLSVPGNVSVPGALPIDDDLGSLNNFAWPEREPSVASAISPASSHASGGVGVSPVFPKHFISRTSSESPRPLSFRDTDPAWSRNVDLIVDGEDTPVNPIFNRNGAPRSSIVPSPSGHPGIPIRTASREEIPPLRTTLGPSPLFQPSSSGGSAGRSIPSPPLSSIGSDSAQSMPGPNIDQLLEIQIRSSPMINDLLDRLARCEKSTREVQRELGTIHQKVNILLDRAFGTQDNDAPEFKNPFAPVALNTPQPGRSSIAPPLNVNDDLSQVSARLNTLTNSVTQLLALQTQQHIQAATANAPFAPPSGFGVHSPLEIAPKQMGMPGHTTPVGPGPAFPPRPDLRGGPRAPNAPMRTWSAGNLDLPRMDNGGPLRQDGMFRGGKRGSVAPITRRESTGMVDPMSDQWNGNSNGASNRDQQSATFKWENLPIAPELLRSIARFGVGPPNKIQQRALPFLLKGSDIIAQAPPTQERIAAYVIPAIHLVLSLSSTRPLRGPLVLMVSTTVDQATQAQRMIRDLGGSIGVRSSLGIGSGGNGGNVLQDVRLLQQNMPHILCGTPQKLHTLFTAPGGISGADVRMLVLDEVDQLIARNLHEFVLNIVKLLPPPRSRPKDATSLNSPGGSGLGPIGSIDGLPNGSGGRRFSSALISPGTPDNQTSPTNQDLVERQTALFSNTVPQDVLNLANTMQLKEPVRVLVRRDGGVTHTESGQTARGLRQFYLYLAFTGGGRKDAPTTPGGGLGIIGSGRGTSNPETAQAREWKLDALADLFEDLEIPQAIVHVGGMTALDSVVYKLANRGLEAIPLHSDMNASVRMTSLNKFRAAATSNNAIRPAPIKVLVIYDVQVKAPDVFQIPFIVNFDLPKAVEEYAHRVAPAISSTFGRAGVVVNFVTATGGDVEMLRSIECFYKIKCPEVPMSLRDHFN